MSDRQHLLLLAPLDHRAHRSRPVAQALAPRNVQELALRLMEGLRSGAGARDHVSGHEREEDG